MAENDRSDVIALRERSSEPFEILANVFTNFVCPRILFRSDRVFQTRLTVEFAVLITSSPDPISAEHYNILVT